MTTVVKRWESQLGHLTTHPQLFQVAVLHALITHAERLRDRERVYNPVKPAPRAAKFTAIHRIGLEEHRVVT